MSYVEGFVIPVPTARKEEFRDFAARGLPLFKEYGALRVVECWGVDVPDGTRTDFKRAVQATPEETVVFAWIVWPSRALRDAAVERMASDPRMQPGEMPFDRMRMIMGGFEVLVDTGYDVA